MKSLHNQKISDSMKLVWATKRDLMMNPRFIKASEIKEKQGNKIRQHFVEHPEHRKAISEAQLVKWVRYKRAVAYCEQNNIDLGEDFL